LRGIYFRIIAVSGFTYIAKWDIRDGRERFTLQGFKRLLGRKFKLQTDLLSAYLVSKKREVLWGWINVIQTTRDSGPLLKLLL